MVLEAIGDIRIGTMIAIAIMIVTVIVIMIMDGTATAATIRMLIKRAIARANGMQLTTVALRETGADGEIVTSNALTRQAIHAATTML